MTYTAIIRQRGQLTVPDALRSKMGWLDDGEAVVLEATQGEVKIRPRSGKRKVDLTDFWRKVELARSFIGKRGNLAEVIDQDRDEH